MRVASGPIFILISFALSITSLPQAAAAAAPYVGVEGGLLFGRDNDVDELVEFTHVQNPANPPLPKPPAAEFDDALSLSYHHGADIGIIAGHDFGLLRLEFDGGYKRAGLKSVGPDENYNSFASAMNAVLNRPASPPDPGAPGISALSYGDFGLSGSVELFSAMINGLVDIDVAEKISIYGGAGYGRSWAKALGDRDSAWGWQWIAGARVKIGDRVEIGLKHRYFNSGILKLRGSEAPYPGNPARVTIGGPSGTTVDATTTALVVPEMEGEFRSRSLLASLIFNF